MTGPSAQPLAGLFRGFRMVLSVQCGEGDLLAALAELQVPCVGLDRDEDNVGSCRERKLVAWQGEWRTLAFHRRKFDGIHVDVTRVDDWDAEFGMFLGILGDALLPQGLLVLSGATDLREAAEAALPAGLEIHTSSRSAVLLSRRPDPAPKPSEFPVLAPYADAFAGCSNVLDLGCGVGRFLDALHVRDVAGSGIESDPDLASECQARGLHAEHGDAGLLASRPGRYDGIHVGGILEALSVESAERLLALCHHALASRGRLLVRTAKATHGPDTLMHMVQTAGFENAETGVAPQDPSNYFLFATRSEVESETSPASHEVPCDTSSHGINGPLTSLADLERHERRVFSQGGEDGVIAAIFELIGTTNRHYVEFGCGDGVQCNTAKLRKDGWDGLLMDGMATPATDEAVIHKEWITADNIDELFRKHGVPDEPDLVSIDLDGNDYWVWQKLSSRPRVVVAEYNANLAVDQALTIPHDPEHQWDGSDYYGASLRALESLGRAKGYRLVYCNAAGVNAFFVREDCLPDGFEPPTIGDVYRAPNFWYRGYRQLPNLARRMDEVH